MPATPFHLGPGILLCRLWGRLGCGPVIAGSVMVDIEPGVVLFLGLDARVHGPLHTIMAAVILGWAAGLLGALAWRWFNLPGAVAGSPGYAGLGGVLGWVLHVLLDSLLYTDITPFQPLSLENPLLGALGPATVEIVYGVTGVLTVWGVFWLFSVSGRSAR